MTFNWTPSLGVVLAVLSCRGNYIDYPTGEIDKAEIKEREWTNNPLNYDNVPEAMLTLFTVSTFEGWPG